MTVFSFLFQEALLFRVIVVVLSFFLSFPSNHNLTLPACLPATLDASSMGGAYEAVDERGRNSRTFSSLG